MSQKVNMDQKLARHTGLTTIIGFLVWMLLMTQVFTYTIMVVSRVILIFLLACMLVALHRFSDEIRQEGGPSWSDEERKKAKRNRYIKWLVVILLLCVMMVPDTPVWAMSLCGAFAAILFLRNHLVGHALRLERKAQRNN